MDLTLRWMEREDADDVLKIEKVIDPECPDNFATKFASKKSSICSVVEFEDKIIGFIFYEIKGISKIKVFKLSVDVDFRRKGVGTFLINSVINKLNQKRNKIELTVSEYNLNAQLFLKNNKFKATEVSESSSGHSEYKFVYNKKEFE